MNRIVVDATTARDVPTRLFLVQERPAATTVRALGTLSLPADDLARLRAVTDALAPLLEHVGWRIVWGGERINAAPLPDRARAVLVPLSSLLKRFTPRGHA